MKVDGAKLGLKASNHYDAGDTGVADQIADSRVRRQQRIRFLRLGEEEHRWLADKLECCERDRRCKSEADPVCVTAFRRKLCRAAGEILAKRSWTRATVFTSKLLVLYGEQLGKFDLRSSVQRLRKQLEQSGLVIASSSVQSTYRLMFVIGRLSAGYCT